jgi:hypothetical protein
MVQFSDPKFEELSKILFRSKEEYELKFIRYNNRSAYLPTMYGSDSSFEDHYEKSIKELEEDITRAKSVLAFFRLARLNNVTYIEEERQEEKEEGEGFHDNS